MSIHHESARRAVATVFDFDGVLVDSEAAHGQALSRAASLLGLPAPSDRPDGYVGLGDTECFARMAAAGGRELQDAELQLLIARKAEVFDRLCRTGEVAAFPGAVDLVRAAAACAPVAVCSGSHRADIEPVLESLGLLPMLQTLVTADDVERTKPDPEPYLLTATRLGLSPGSCAAIEDSPAGVAAARAAGYRRVHAVCHTFAKERLGEAHEIHGCIAEITAARLME